MKKLEIFDPALCCSTGVCGPSPDQQLMAFAGVLKGFEGQADIRRHNLAQDPAAFSNNPVVKEILQEDGTDGLPAILIDGRVAMKGVYPSKEQLCQLLGLSSGEASCCVAENDDEACCAPESDREACCETEDQQTTGSCC